MALLQVPDGKTRLGRHYTCAAQAYLFDEGGESFVTVKRHQFAVPSQQALDRKDIREAEPRSPQCSTAFASPCVNEVGLKPCEQFPDAKRVDPECRRCAESAWHLEHMECAGPAAEGEVVRSEE